MVPIIGDLHIGARSGNEHFHEYFNKFFDDFFEFCDKNGVEEFIQTGDMFDVRKFVNTWCLDFFKEHFVKRVVDRGMTCYVIVGNHDIHFRETLKVNTPSLVLSEWKDNFVVIENPMNLKIGGHSFLMVPWMAKSNREECEEAIKMSSSDYMCGHFEFNDFPMHVGSNAKSHHSHKGYGQFKKIFSGHYHTKSEKDNVIYTGTPYELTWIDCGDKKGFYTLDDSGNVDFVHNPHIIHDYVVYPEVKDCSKKFIRAIADNVEDKKALEKWKSDLIASGPHDIKFNEKTTAIQSTETIDVENIKSTEDLLIETVDEMETHLDKGKLKSMILKCYSQVQGDPND